MNRAAEEQASRSYATAACRCVSWLAERHNGDNSPPAPRAPRRSGVATHRTRATALRSRWCFIVAATRWQTSSVHNLLQLVELAVEAVRFSYKLLVSASLQ